MDFFSQTKLNTKLKRTVPGCLLLTGVAKQRPRQQMVLAVGNAVCSAYSGVCKKRFHSEPVKSGEAWISA